MKLERTLGTVLALAVFAVAAHTPSSGHCDSNRRISTVRSATAYSYLYTPGVVLGDNGIAGSSVTERFAGVFWAVGWGNPVSPSGADSGSFPALDWLAFGGSGYPVVIHTGWTLDARIDGCIDATTATCTAIQLTDVDPQTGQPVFALLSASADGFLNFNFNQVGNAPIILAPLPAPALVGSTRDYDTGQIHVDLAPIQAQEFDAGLYLDPNCRAAGGGGVGIESLVPGVSWYTQEVPRGAPAPSDPKLETGGWIATGVSTEFGVSARLDLVCSGDTEIYVTYAFVNESGIPAPATSSATTRIQCSPNFAHPGNRWRIRRAPVDAKPGNRGR